MVLGGGWRMFGRDKDREGVSGRDGLWGGGPRPGQATSVLLLSCEPEEGLAVPRAGSVLAATVSTDRGGLGRTGTARDTVRSTTPHAPRV